MAKNMATKINCLDRPPASRRPDGRMSGGAAREDLTEALSVERYVDYQAMLEQGLRLNRAFIAINDPRVRETIVNLVVEAANNEATDETRVSPLT